MNLSKRVFLSVLISSFMVFILITSTEARSLRNLLAEQVLLEGNVEVEVFYTEYDYYEEEPESENDIISSAEFRVK